MEQALAELGFDILNDVCLNQVIFRYRDDAHTQEVIRKIQQSGKTWFGPTHWRGQLALRFSECSWVTTDEDIAITLGAIREALAN
jgi:glutamate/tyrosine decarboxylase-like PLP-dependent enzyme